MRISKFANIGEDVTSTRSTNYKRGAMSSTVFDPVIRVLGQMEDGEVAHSEIAGKVDTGILPEEDPITKEALLHNVEVFVRFMTGQRFRSPDRNTETKGKMVREATAEAFGLDRDVVDEAKSEAGKTSLGIEAVYTNPSGAVQSTLTQLEPMSARTIKDVYEQIDRLPDENSDNARVSIVAELLSECESAKEAKWVSFCVLGDLSLYMGWKTVADAFAQSTHLTEEQVKQGARLSYRDLPTAIREYLDTGEIREQHEIGVPFKPMLAESDELENIPDGWVGQPKYDGARVLIHSDGEEVRVFSRNGKEVTESLVEITENIDPEYPFILDGEAVGYNPETDDPFPFEKTMTRFTRTEDIEEARRDVPLRVFLFDIVNYRGEDISGISFEDRERSVARVARDCVSDSYETLWSDTDVEVVTNDVISTVPALNDLEKVWELALESGHEGVIARDPDAPFVYQRDSDILKKIKPEETIDVRVWKTERGTGENAQRLGHIYIETGDSYKLGRTGNGFSDEERERYDPVDGESLEGEIVEITVEGISVTGEDETEYGVRFPRIERLRDSSDAQPDSLERALDIAN